MELRSVHHVARGSGGTLLRGSPDIPVRRVCTDSRQVQPGDVFFALSGDKFDGHAFLAETVAKGAVAIVGETGRLPAELRENCAVIRVENTRRALGQYAAYYRSEFKLPVVAVAGSNGKTTTKELIASVLRQELSAVWSEASFNNDVGVPLTLLRIEASHQVAIVEAGTNHPGELANLVKLIQPRYGVITCIGREHLEFFGDVAGVAQEEGSLAELLPPDGLLLLNGSDEWTSEISRRTRAGVLKVGLGEGNEWRARAVRPDKQGASFRLDCPLPEYGGDYRVNLLGRHQVVNALFAIAIAAQLGVSRESVVKGLAECLPSKMRMQYWEQNGVRVLDDAYNANADSMVAALKTLQEFPCKGRRVAVLGDMAELGPHSESAHEEVGRCAAELGVGQLFAVGKWAPVLARGARAAGLHRVFEFADVEAAAAAVRSFVKEGDLLLLKASRATRLERVAELLRRVETGKKN